MKLDVLNTVCGGLCVCVAACIYVQNDFPIAKSHRTIDDLHAGFVCSSLQALTAFKYTANFAECWTLNGAMNDMCQNSIVT